MKVHHIATWGACTSEEVSQPGGKNTWLISLQNASLLESKDITQFVYPKCSYGITKTQRELQLSLATYIRQSEQSSVRHRMDVVRIYPFSGSHLKLLDCEASQNKSREMLVAVAQACNQSIIQQENAGNHILCQ